MPPTDSTKRATGTVCDAALAWTETLEFTDDAARVADATLVTADGHFERVPDLSVRLIEHEDD